jgi:uncharacterized protein
MTWDPAISRKISAVKNDLAEFTRLLKANPDYLLGPDGTDLWMWSAALNGKLDVIKALVELGLDVNVPKDSEDANDPYYTPEGPILHAAAEGHVDVVRWLLDHGARINYTVRGQSRCLPLLQAATNGHLPVVTALVEHGADIHATWDGTNAITQAALYGHRNVRDYLRSLGAKDVREITPPDFETSHQRFIQQMTQSGPLQEWSLELPGEPTVMLYLVPTNAEGTVKTVFTVGLCDRRLPTEANEFAATELLLMLSADWPLTEASLRDPLWNWPIEWLKRIVCELRAGDCWPAEPALFMNGNPPEPLAPNTELCGWLCMLALGQSLEMTDYRTVDIHSLIPIYEEERALVETQGHEELVNRLMARGIPTYIDPTRTNVALERG